MNIKSRVISEAKYIIENDATIRKAGLKFNISKSSIHKDINLKLKKYDSCLYDQVKDIFKKHNINKHIKGGLRTALKYRKDKNEEE